MLKVITGPMFSGKTTMLLKEFHATCDAMLFKHVRDGRYSTEKVCSHVGVSAFCACVNNGWDIKPRAGISNIFIDEAQFFDMTLTLRIDELLRLGYSVTVAGLDTDWEGRPFGEMGVLLAKADDVCKLRAVCSSCLLPAIRTKRLTGEIEQVIVGGSESYTAMCRRCWERE